MSARVPLSSDIGLFLVERLLQYPVLANVDSYPIIRLCRIFTYFYEHKQSSSLSQLSLGLGQQMNFGRRLRSISQIANLHFEVVNVISLH